jgi:AraC-like DNA-binding protein
MEAISCLTGVLLKVILIDIIMVLHIKGMVSHSCKLVVSNIISAKGYRCLQIDLGEVEIAETPGWQELAILKGALTEAGFDLLSDHNEVLAERIKDAVISAVRYSTDDIKTNFSEYLSEYLHYSYTYLSNVFTKITGQSIGTYVILQKTEYIKELLQDKELTLSEIAYKLHYSSTSHLCNQFKKVTGMSPSVFRNQRNKGRSCLESI